MAISVFLARLLAALQGDDEASGGRALDAIDVRSEAEVTADEEDEEDADLQYEDDDAAFASEVQHVGIGRGFETAKGSSHDMGDQWSKIKE
jgi:hypothetical protein